ncbi:hypothetical protein NKR23_g11934 [Pleurostoma richardsiae]|uniref:Uncharacterized protein n=1 Tax=Pleurostoma richardsiae TaxID=41990 RepID=A0AA38RAS4_9PEZI|nr:hypothetical protein NKR23_g11934 [Pleurostoma richardsiae]
MSIRAPDVYVGFWTDWSKDNPIMGWTLTLPASLASLLTACLAMYVSFVASHLWHLIAYTIHYIRQRVTRGKCRPMLRQQQVVLRSGLSPASTVVRLTELFWANRSTSRSLRNSWLLTLLSLLCAIGGIVAGLYSAKISDSSQVQVLLKSNRCGILNNTALPSDSEVVLASGNYYLDMLNLATTYAQRCYNATDVDDCNPFATYTINWTSHWNLSCPFDESMCVGPAMKIDTAAINSNTILGLNSPPEDQVDLRKISTCAPITQNNYTKTVSALD